MRIISVLDERGKPEADHLADIQRQILAPEQ
jgi:hypothetical protein